MTKMILKSTISIDKLQNVECCKSEIRLCSLVLVAMVHKSTLACLTLHPNIDAF